MTIVEETIEATLDSSGQLRLAQVPRLLPGPVQVTIRSTTPNLIKRGLADVLREIASDQRIQGFVGRSAEEFRKEDANQLAEDVERDAENESASKHSNSEEQ